MKSTRLLFVSKLFICVHSVFFLVLSFDSVAFQGKAAKDVSLENAFDFILGYSVANDVSARHWQLEKTLSGNLGKSKLWMRPQQTPSLYCIGCFIKSWTKMVVV